MKIRYQVFTITDKCGIKAPRLPETYDKIIRSLPHCTTTSFESQEDALLFLQSYTTDYNVLPLDTTFTILPIITME